MEEFRRQEEETEGLQNIVDQIVDLAAEKLLQTYLKKRAEQKTALQVVESMYQSLAIQMRKPDPGEADASLNPRWTAEAEAPPCEIDRFARGMIPLRHRPGFRNMMERKVTLNVRPGTAVIQSRAPSIGGSSVGSRRSRYSVATTSARSNVRANRKGGKKGEKEEALEPYEIPPEVDEEEIKMDKLRETELRKMERRRKAAQKAAEAKRKAVEEAGRLKRLQEELKGKHYTFDQDGNVILIHTLKAEKMPAITLEPKIKLKSSQPVVTEADENHKDKNKSRMKNKLLKNKHASGSREKKKKDVSKYLEKIDTEPPLMDVIKLQSGVTIRDAVTGAVKQGEDPETNDTLQMTRTEYNSMLDSNQPLARVMQPLQASGDSGGGHAVDFGKDANINENADLAISRKIIANQTEKEAAKSPAEAKGAAGSSGASGAAATPSGAGPAGSSGCTVGEDINPLEGTTSFLVQERGGHGLKLDHDSLSNSQVSPSASPVARGGLTSMRGGRAGRRRLRGRGKQHFVMPMKEKTPRSREQVVKLMESMPVEEEDMDSFNQTILQDPFWGANKATGLKPMLRPKPLKASPKQRAKTVGVQRARLPRDRAAIPLSTRKATTGKGKSKVKGYLSPKTKKSLNELTINKDPSTIFGRSTAYDRRKSRH
mmetsp:Transcript_8084/g.14996  ORF Transcript_8084/g.14996 Transcript_8084/m.14996 type:complete len:655 (+) Transcript_8084:100-2064(+)